MSDNKTHRSALHFHGVDFVRGVKNVEDVLNGDVHLKVLLAVGLETEVGELVEEGGGEKIERVLRWHVRVPEVNVAKETFEGFRSRHSFSDCDLRKVDGSSLSRRGDNSMRFQSSCGLDIRKLN